MAATRHTRRLLDLLRPKRERGIKIKPKRARVIGVFSCKGGVGKSLGYSEFVSLYNGDSIQIGPYIDGEIERNPTKVRKIVARTIGGKNEIFEVLKCPEHLVLDTVSFKKRQLQKITKRPILLMRKPAPGSLIEVKTNSGPIVVTPEHNFLAMRDGAIRKVRTEDLRKGEDYLLHFSSDNFARHRGGVPLGVAELLGYIIGDGYMEGHNIHVFSGDPAPIESNFTHVLGSFKSLKTKRGERGRSLYRTSFYNKPRVKELYEKYGVKIAKSAKKEVPSALFSSSNRRVAAFIRALFDCDAHVNKNRREIEFVSKSKKLVLQVACILRSRFGIASQIKRVYNSATNATSPVKKKYWKLIVSSTNLKEYYHKIGFKNRAKMDRLRKWVSSDSASFNTNIDVFPVGKTLKKIRKRGNLSAADVAKKMDCTQQSVHGYERCCYAPSKGKLCEFIRIFDSFGVRDRDVKSLRQLVAAGFSFRRVTSLKRIKYSKPYVYDFQVSEEGAHFIHGTGIVVSNTTAAVNIGAHLADNVMGRDVLVVDANLGAPNLGLHLGRLTSDATIHDVLAGERPIEDAVTDCDGVHAILGSIAYGEEIHNVDLRGVLEPLRRRYKLIILDSAPGVGSEVASAMKACDEMLIVTNPYAPTVASTLKTFYIARRRKIPILGVVMNKVRGEPFELSCADVKRVLGWPIVAVVPEDAKVRESTAKGIPVVRLEPKSPGAAKFAELGDFVVKHLRRG